MRNGRSFSSARRGFTLTELMIVVVLMGVIGTALTLLLMRQQRFHRAVVSITDSRARMRDVSTILPTDLRSISTAADDILDFTTSSIQFRAYIGTAVVCRFRTLRIVEIPPRMLSSKVVLTSWINPPGPGDIAYLYNDGDDDGNFDDEWDRHVIEDTVSSTNPEWCDDAQTPKFTEAADDGERRYRITLTADADTVRVKRGGVIRFAREVKYSAYQAADNQWYVGYQTCEPNANPALAGVCGTTELLAGPIKAATTDTTTSGLFFVMYNKSGVRITDPASTDTIARVSVGIRTFSESMRQASSTSLSTMTGGDSLRFVIGFRNRI
jgi:prepilin-type N-terminal cleavage/methylation domain-containing protein